MDPSNFIITKLTEASIFTILEVIVGLFAIWYLMKRPMRKRMISEEERERLLSAWQPEPLISDVLENHEKLNTRIVSDKLGKYMTVNNIRCLNLGTHNYLGVLENRDIQESAIRTIKKYGVGSCGPRGFYGTLDVHLDLEQRLAEFMGAEEAVVYSYSFCTISSAIPAYCKRNDIIFTDEMLSFPAQKGLDASRSTVYFYKHNDMEDLERLLIEHQQKSFQNVKKAKKTRLFLIVEAISMNTGKMCPLPELVKLRAKYKLRMFLDETLSFGVLGKTGRGITEHFNIDRKEIDLIMGSLETSIGSVGGFCVGSHFIIEHQRLSGLGYCFSASCPPCLTQAAIDAIDLIENEPKKLSDLAENCRYFHEVLQTIPEIEENSFDLSPVKHLYARNENHSTAKEFLNTIVRKCEARGYALTVSNYLEDVEIRKNRPSIRLAVNALLTKDEIDDFIKVLREVCAS